MPPADPPPAPSGDLVERADALNDRGAYAEGLLAAEEAIAASEGDARAWTSKGWALENLGRLAEAEDAYRTALAHDPGLPWPAVGLATVLEKTGRSAEARALYRSVADRSPLDDTESADLLEIVGWSCLKTGRLEESIRLFEAALRIEPDRTAVRFDLALALLAEGREDAALAEYRAGLTDAAGAEALRANVMVALEDLLAVAPMVPRAGGDQAEALLRAYLEPRR